MSPLIRRAGCSPMAVMLPALLLLVAAKAKAQDDADYAQEARFHRIYKAYNEKPTSADAWKANLSNGHSQSYQVQKKDTLWEISAVLFGDANYWPKVWSLNGMDVENPHEILPSQEMHFTEGTFGEPPALSVKEGMSEGDQMSEPMSSVTGDSMSEGRPVYPDGEVTASELPEAKVPSTKLAPFPPSLPTWKVSSGLADFQLDVRPVPQVTEGTEQSLDYYISEKSMDIEGEIAETEQGTLAASDRQQVYVRFKEVPTSTRYLVIQELDEVPDPWQKRSGRIIQVQGELEVIEIVNPSKNLYRARPVKNFNHLMIGAKVIAQAPVYFTPSRVGELATQVPARVIGGSYDAHRSLFGPREIVFINAGASDGLAANQIYSIFKNQQVRVEDSEVITHPPVVGHLKIIQVTDIFATAVVTDATDEVRVGDMLSVGAREN